VGIGDEVAQELAFRWGDDLEIYKRYSPLEQHEHIESPVLFVVGGEDDFKDAGREFVTRLRANGRTAIYSEYHKLSLYQENVSAW